MSSSFLSKIEAGKEKPPAEKKLRALAKAVDCEAVWLLGISGRLPADVVKTIQKHPCEYVALIRQVRNLDAKQLKHVLHRIPITFMDIPVSSEEMESFRELFQRGKVSQLEIRLVPKGSGNESSEV